ncbi:MAG TPA: extracellular solute-binding protein, partial [Limnochordia bacterium]|nr:extracellular solute-binding protein [Limnochordia bacterium]
MAQSAVYGGSFTGGTAAMEMDGTVGIGSGYDNVIKNSFAWDIGPYPKGPSGSRGTWVASDMWGVNAATKHPNEVWEFIKYLVSDPAVERQETLTGQGPMTHSGYRIYSQVFRNYDSRWHVDSAQNAHIQYVGFVPYADKVTPLVGAAVTQIFNLKKSPKVAADEAGQQVKGMYQLLKSGQDAAKAKPVPITWANQDWSSAAINELPIGDAKIDGDNLTIDAAGADIWGAQDGLHYVHQSVTGDFTAVVKLHSTADVNGWAKAGIMVRQSDDPGSTHLMVMGTGTNGIHIQYRPKANDSSKDMAGDGWDQKSPIWLKLERKGQSLTGYSSTDGS